MAFEQNLAYPIYLRVIPEAGHTPHHFALVLYDEPGHQASCKVDVSTIGQEGETFDLRAFLDAYRQLEAGRAAEQRFGRALFHTLIGAHPSMLQCWQRMRTAAGSRPLALHVVFGRFTEKMFELPLELLHHDQFLFRTMHSSLIRCIAEMTPAAFSCPAEPKVLFLWACPPKEAPGWFDAAPHEAVMRDLFGDRLTMVPNATLPSIEKALAAESFDIVHILAHGYRENGFGALVLNGAEGGTHYVDAEVVGDLFKGHGIRLAFLCSCKTAVSGDHNLSGVGQQLLYPHGGDIEAVIATQANLLVAGSVALTRIFYKQLRSRPEAPGEAIGKARVAAYRYGDGWSAPVLLSRPPLLQQPARLKRIPVGLPRRIETWIARDELMADIVNAARNQRVVMVVGLPGIGKTQLGKEAARRLHEQHVKQRLVYLEIDPKTTTDSLRARVATGLGLAKIPEDDGAMVGVLGTDSTLLVLDNAEDLMPDQAHEQGFSKQLRTWLGAENLTLLLTTRWPVPGLPGEEIVIPSLTPQETETLLIKEIGRRFQPAWQAQPAWAELLSLLDGHPRSIWLVAHHFDARRIQLKRVVQRLKALKSNAVVDASLIGRKDVADALNSEERDRMLSLAASMNYSFDILSQRHPDAAQLFIALSCFPAGLPIAVTEAVAGGADSPALDHLIRYNLLEYAAERTSYPVPLRWYAESKIHLLKEPMDSYRLRAAIAFVAFVATCDAMCQVSGGVEAVRAWLLEEATILDLCNWLQEREHVEQRFAIVGRIAGFCRNLFTLSGRLEVWEQITTWGLADARRYKDHASEANCLKSLGDLARRQDALSQAQAHYEAALPIFRRIEDRLGEANCLQSLGDLAMRQDALSQAQAHYEAALPIYRRIEARLGEANCLKSLGDLAMRQDALSQAQAHYEAALPIYRRIEARLGEANCLKSLGDLAMRQDALSQAQAHYEAALPIFRRIEDRLGEANCLQSLGDLAMRQDALSQAQAHYEAALPIYRRIEDRLGEANCLQSLGDLAMRQDALSQAQAHNEAALPIYRRIEARLGEANCLKSLGDLAMRQDALSQAQAQYEAALPIYRRIEARLGEANCLKRLGDLARRQDALSQAQAHYEAALPIYRRIESRLGEANCLQSLGDLAMRQSALSQAQAHYEAALPIYRRIEDRLGEATCLKSLGDLAMRQDALSQAQAHYEAALPIYRRIEDRLGEANCRQSLGLLALQKGEIRPAFEQFCHVFITFGEIEERLGQQAALGYLARAALMAGHSNRALVLSEASLQMGRQAADKHGQAITLDLQCQVHQGREQIDAFLACALLCRRMAQQAQYQQKFEQYDAILTTLQDHIPAEAWQQITEHAEDIRLAAVAEAQDALDGADLFTLPESET